ncbi:MAG: 50S ribosomal protein L32 [Candidatus Cloacimonetes bacterium]|jgi:large subunit ribosomal protein L32|nr:50S ribosomal protein L32 [Candidatus Cloacimonadota bacterium]
MAVPKKKVSKQRRRKRRGAMKAEMPSVQSCPKCGDPKLPHRVCPTCGTYKGEQVLEVEEI